MCYEDRLRALNLPSLAFCTLVVLEGKTHGYDSSSIMKGIDYVEASDFFTMKTTETRGHGMKIMKQTSRLSRKTVLPCLVPSSPIRPLATVARAPVHPALSLASRIMLLMVAPLEYHLSVSSHLCLGLPLLLVPFILPSITSYSIPPALTTCPK